MERTPAIILLFLISLVVISAITGADDRGDDPAGMREDGPVSVIPFKSAHGPDGRSQGILFIQRSPQLLNSETVFLEDNIAKSETMAARLNETIDRLEAEGNDVGRLDELLNDYTLNVRNAKMYLEMTDAPGEVDIDAGSSPVPSDEEQMYLEQSRDHIVQANVLLKEIFHELKPHLALHARIVDSTLTAKGRGTVVLSGDLEVELVLSNGKLSYVDLKDDVSVQTGSMDRPEVTRMPDMRQELVSYDNLSGNVVLSGSGFIMEVTGEDISLVATGNGEAELFGNGTYYIGKESSPENKQIWIPPLFENN